MFNQLGLLAESLPASRAVIGLQASVKAEVLGEDRRLAEGFPTLAALIGPISSVDYAVLNEM